MRRPFLRITVIAALIVVAVMLWPVLLLQLDGASDIPPRHVLPELPPGVEIVGDSKGCGSGGCFREVVVAAPEDPTALRELPDRTACRLTAVYDWRPVCITTERSAGTVTFYLQYDTFID